MLIFLLIVYLKYPFKTLLIHIIIVIFVVDMLFILLLLLVFIFRFCSFLFCCLFIRCLFSIYRFSFLSLKSFCLSFCVHCVILPSRLILCRFITLVAWFDELRDGIDCCIIIFATGFKPVSWRRDYDQIGLLHTMTVVSWVWPQSPYSASETLQ